MSMVQQAVEVGAPLHTVYEHLAKVENYPRFMHGVEQVIRVGHDRTHWVMDVEGHRREFDATMIERSFDERLSWATTDGPLLAETLTLRPIGEARTQVVAQLEADVAFLLPGDRHGPATLNRWLKSDLDTFKSLCESGELGPAPDGASSSQVSGRSSTIFGSGPERDPAAPPAITGRAPGRRAGGPASFRSATDQARGATAPMGGQAMSTADAWGDGMINEEDRGSAHDL